MEFLANEKNIFRVSVRFKASSFESSIIFSVV